MSWTNINLKDISTQVELIPEGTYDLELSPGAKFNETGTLLVSARVINNGEFNGKPVFFSYPDPESVSKSGKVNSWSAVALKRLVESLGAEPEEGEAVDTMLNRLAGSHFSMPVAHTKPTDEYPTVRLNPRIFNVKPAA